VKEVTRDRKGSAGLSCIDLSRIASLSPTIRESAADARYRRSAMGLAGRLGVTREAAKSSLRRARTLAWREYGRHKGQRTREAHELLVESAFGQRTSCGAQ